MIKMKTRCKNRRILFWIGLLVIGIGCVICCFWGRIWSNGEFPKEVYGVPVHTAIISKGDPARPGIRRQIKYIVIHETGNKKKGGNARSHSNFLLHNNDSKTSWHYTVDDHEIYHHIPDNEVAWHAGDLKKKSGGNLNGIGIELCVNEDGDFEKTFDNAAKLTAYLIKAYDLSVEDIKQHADFIHKNCPETIRRDHRMGEFISLVTSYINQ